MTKEPSAITVDEFCKEIIEWLNNNGFAEIRCRFDYDFAYNFDKQYIYIGVEEYPDIDMWFAEFVDSLGCEYEDIFSPTLAFLHELGHHKTLNLFTDEEMWACYYMKQELRRKDSKEHNKGNAIKYWEVADELKATIWETNYINDNSDAVNALDEIFKKYWNIIVGNTNLVFSII